MISLLLLGLTLLQAKGASAPIQDEPLTTPTLVYPPEAREARIQGSVELQIDVDADGHVTAVHALDGPIPLRQAAIDAYSRATYRPILRGGRATPAIITTTVRFTLAELPPDTDQRVDAEFEPLLAACQRQSDAKDAEAFTTCRQAVEISHRFTASAQLEARETAYNDVVLLLNERRKYRQAVAVADEAIALVAGTNHAHTPAFATAYISGCEAHYLNDDLKPAAEDCANAEETLTNLIDDQGAPTEKKLDRTAEYRSELHETFELHALILNRLHREKEAREVREREALY